MTDNEITREKTFSEELPYLKERIKEVFYNYDNLNDNEDPLYIAVLRDSKRIVRKAEEEITRQQSEIESLKIFRGYAEKRASDYRTMRDKYLNAKSEAYKECLAKVKNYIKTHCNPYGKPDFDYDTSIKVLNFIGNLVKEMVGEEE